MKYNRLTLSTLLAVGFSCTTVFFSSFQPSYSQDTVPQTPIDSNSETEKEVSQQELQKFAQAYQEVQKIQKSSEAQMVQAVEGEGLSPERFIEISKSQQNTESDSNTTGVSTEEKESFENAKAKIIEIRQTTESDMTQAINKQGLEIPRFNEILTALQQDSELREQFQQMMVN
ncbi:MAG: hypothetical protein Kow0049_27610 [Stanieria sp.]